MKMSANSYSILKKLGHKPRTFYMREKKNKFASQRPSIFTIMFIIYSSILKSLIKLRSESVLMYSSPVVTNFIRTITPGILDRFRRSKWPPKALKKIFLTVPKTSQSSQYSLSYQQISL